MNGKQSRTFQSLKDDPASNECCTWSNHQIECGQCTGAMKYLGLTKGKCSWDRTFGDIYEFPSNDGKKYDTSFCNIKTDFDEASQICSLLGGRLFNEEVLAWNDGSSMISEINGCS